MVISVEGSEIIDAAPHAPAIFSSYASVAPFLPSRGRTALKNAVASVSSSFLSLFVSALAKAYSRAVFSDALRPLAVFLYL